MQKMKVFFIKVKPKNEKKKQLLKIKRAHLKAEIKESALPHFFKPCLIIMHHPVQYHLSLRRQFNNDKYVIAKLRCVLVNWWCSSKKLKFLLLDLSFIFFFISLNLKSIKVSMFKYFVLITILLLLFFENLFQQSIFASFQNLLQTRQQQNF